MRKLTLLFPVFAAVVAVGAALAATPNPAGGIWEAKTKDGFLRFSVHKGKVKGFVASYGCTPGGISVFQYSEMAIKADGSFGYGSSVPLTGKFARATLARGTVQPNLGIGHCTDRTPRAFTARKLTKKLLIPKAGRWKGKDATGAPLEFIVDTFGVVKAIKLSSDHECVRRDSMLELESEGLVRPSTAAFRARYEFFHPGQATSRVIFHDFSGRFSSPSSAAGKLQEGTYGTAPSCDSGPITWTASFASP